jgi:GntR family transcriptional regulator
MVKRVRPRALDRANSTPLWQQLEADLQRRMDAGAFETAFPGEFELAEQYQVSRHTVREALRRMRRDGVIDSARGRGSSVSRPELQQPLGALYSLFRSVEMTGVEQRSQVLVLDTRTDAAVAARLGVAEDTGFVFLERLRLADSEPLAHDRTWLLRDLAEPLLGGQFGHSGLYDELARLTGARLTGSREVIRAVLPPPELRRLLGLRAGTAALAVERIGCLDGAPVEYRESLIRGDRFAMSAEWPGRGEYRVDVTGMGAG